MPSFSRSAATGIIAAATVLACIPAHGQTTRASTRPTTTQPAASDQDKAVGHARKVFADLVALSDAFDPALADLYDDNALIRNKRVYPDRTTRDLIIPANRYKGLIRAAMPLAKARGDRSTYSEVTYTPEAGRVRIAATRFSILKNYSSPISWLVGPNADGKWVIYEELSESRP